MGSRLEHVIARNVAELRTERGWTQAELAEEMRAWGFTWATNRVTQLETLRRPVSLLEVIGLGMVFAVPATRLLGGDDRITLPDGREFPLVFLREALIGGEPERRFFTPKDYMQSEADFQELRKMAAKLGLSNPEDLATLAHKMFGHSFRDEQDVRLGDVSHLSKRSAQTKRGHVSRAMLAEVEGYLGEGKERAVKLDHLHDWQGGAEEGGES
jgi:transcriptional regulator with XRE-family HTH domain